MSECEQCGGDLSRWGLYGCDDGHPLPTLAQRIARAIERDLNNRRGYHLDVLGNHERNAILDKWSNIIEKELWISVRDQLPPVRKQVLFCCEIDGDFSEVIAGQYSGNWTESKNAVAMELGGDDWAPCSHWMEIPKPPEK